MTIVKSRYRQDGFEEPESTVESKLELAKHLAEVQSQIKEEITSDFVLAKLDSKDKLMIVEMTANAYYGRNLVKVVALNHKKWYWDNENKRWEAKRLTKKDRDTMNQISKNTFNTFMIRPTMLSILNRNQKDNYLVKHMFGVPEEQENAELLDENKKNLIGKIGEKLKNEEQT